MRRVGPGGRVLRVGRENSLRRHHPRVRGRSRSAASLANEIFLIRLLSPRFCPRLMTLITSRAMLGFGASGVALHLLRASLPGEGRPIYSSRIADMILLW